MKIKQMFKSIGYAGRGLFYVLKHEQNFRIECASAIAILVVSFYFGISRAEFIIVLLLIVLVLMLELLNSALEKFVDLLKPRLHTQVGVLKDIMAAMVLIASVGAAIIGIIIFWPYFIETFFR